MERKDRRTAGKGRAREAGGRELRWAQKRRDGRQQLGTEENEERTEMSKAVGRKRGG